MLCLDPDIITLSPDRFCVAPRYI